MSKNLVIIAVDDTGTRKFLAEVVALEGLRQRHFADVKLALEALKARPSEVILVISDVKMPGTDGILFLRQAKKFPLETASIIASGHETGDNIVAALKLCALDYLEKPFQLKEVRGIIQKIKQTVNETRQEVELYRYLKEKKICFKIGSDVRLAHSLVDELIREITRIGGKTLQSELAGIRTALYEAVVNAIEHGNLELASTLKEKPDYLEIMEKRMTEPSYADRMVEVTATITTTSFSCEITDEGAGFDWRSLSDPRDPENLLKPHGRGIILMADYFDRVTFNQQGNSVIMEKDLVMEGTTP